MQAERRHCGTADEQKEKEEQSKKANGRQHTSHTLRCPNPPRWGVCHSCKRGRIRPRTEKRKGGSSRQLSRGLFPERRAKRGGGECAAKGARLCLSSPFFFSFFIFYKSFVHILRAKRVLFFPCRFVVRSYTRAQPCRVFSAWGASLTLSS